MSDALNYLVKARPEAMTSYFTFLKKAGDHLDTRSRDLISVITKVAVQTEGGFKQYLTRALRNGATPNEIIDAQTGRSIADGAEIELGRLREIFSTEDALEGLTAMGRKRPAYQGK